MVFDSLIKGFVLAGFSYSIGMIMDITISRNSWCEMIEEIPELYNSAIRKIQQNMLVISPLLYCVVDQTLIDHTTSTIQPIKTICIFLTHSVGYYIVHKSMHTIGNLRKYHEFHHRFDKHMIPSIGNAVSTEEFLFAYVSPFIIGAYFFRPNEISFVIPIGLVSVFNNIIHCKELRGLQWPEYLVSPDQHIEHHETRTKHYSAPVLNIDYFLED
mgnify:CR=1 FL=1